MTPNTDNILLENLDTVAEQTSRTYCLDIEKNTISNFCDGVQAMRQTIYCILNTERFNHLIYSWNYGIETEHLIGANTTYIIPELERVITEALLQDTRMAEVKEFNFDVEKNKVIVRFTVVTTVGDIEIEKVVNI